MPRCVEAALESGNTANDDGQQEAVAAVVEIDIAWEEYSRKLLRVALGNDQEHLPELESDVHELDDEIVAAFQKVAAKILLVDAVGVAEELNNLRVANSVLIGALSSVMEVSTEDWLAVLTARVPERHKEVNHRAFFAGRDGQWLVEN